MITTATRELTWGLPLVAEEVCCWRRLASTIPDAALREDALKAITEQRGHIDGAALFSILPRARNKHLLQLLVAYEIIWDFLDNVNERTANIGVANGLQLHRALVDALDPEQPISDYYEHIPQHNDGGYLHHLVVACRMQYTTLASRRCIHESVIREAIRGRVCALNHDPSALIRDIRLRAWATEEFPCGHEAQWFELTAAASTDLTIYALLAAASDATCTQASIAHIQAVYFPWVSVLTAMLDSYADQVDDAATGNHSYLAHYPNHRCAIQHVSALMDRCLNETSSLKDAEKHTVIAACMFALYLSKSTVLTPKMRRTTNGLVASGGTLTRVLHPILRLWRAAYDLRAA